ncbi:MAG: DUF2934 domain-containing protein [Solirubrobacteraceae bacterium]
MACAGCGGAWCLGSGSPARRRRPTRGGSRIEKPVAPSRAAIAERAYHLYLDGVPGGETEHWVLAERQLSSPRPTR